VAICPLINVIFPLYKLIVNINVVINFSVYQFITRLMSLIINLNVKRHCICYRGHAIYVKNCDEWLLISGKRLFTLQPTKSVKKFNTKMGEKKEVLDYLTF